MGCSAPCPQYSHPLPQDLQSSLCPQEVLGVGAHQDTSSNQALGVPAPQHQALNKDKELPSWGSSCPLFFPGKFSGLRVVFEVEQAEPISWTLVGLTSWVLGLG